MSLCVSWFLPFKGSDGYETVVWYNGRRAIVPGIWEGKIKEALESMNVRSLGNTIETLVSKAKGRGGERQTRFMDCNED